MPLMIRSMPPRAHTSDKTPPSTLIKKTQPTASMRIRSGTACSTIPISLCQHTSLRGTPWWTCFVNDGLFPDGSPYVSANIITYNPQYDASGQCPMPANSLLAPTNTLYTLCNIYSDTKYTAYDGSGDQYLLTPICPKTAADNQSTAAAFFVNRNIRILHLAAGAGWIYPTNPMGFSARTF